METGITDQVKEGNLSAITNLFSGGEDFLQNALFANVKQSFMNGIMEKLGLPESIAGLVAGSGLESIIGKVTGMVKGDAGNVDENKLLSTLGLDGGNIGDIAKNLLKDKLGGLGGLAGGLFGK